MHPITREPFENPNRKLAGFFFNYFRRTYDQKEIDLVEEREGMLYGYKIKWKKARAKPQKDWLDTYKNPRYEVITRENYLEFIKS